MAAVTNEEFLGCPVCLSTLQSPRVLPCGHSICEACLEPLIEAENEKLKVKCPECRSDYERPADGFPKNFKLAEMLDKLKMTADRSMKKCHACEDSVHVSKAFRCLACEKDFALREIIMCGSCAIRNHKGHTILDLSALPKECYEQIGEGAASLTMPDFMDFRDNAETPVQGPTVEVSGVSWCVTAWHEESQLEGLDLVHWCLDATFPDVRRVWVDAEFSFVKADGGTVLFGRIAKELLGATTLPRRAGFAIAKCHLVPQYLHEDGTMQMTVDFRVFKDVYSEQHEVWDTRLIVDDHAVYVSRPMVSAESSVLTAMLLDDSVSVIPVTNVTAAELILFIVHLHNFIDDWEHDTGIEGSMINRIVARMTAEDIASTCVMLKCKIARRNGSEPKLDNETLIDLLAKCISVDAASSDTSSDQGTE